MKKDSKLKNNKQNTYNSYKKSSADEEMSMGTMNSEYNYAQKVNERVSKDDQMRIIMKSNRKIRPGSNHGSMTESAIKDRQNSLREIGSAVLLDSQEPDEYQSQPHHISSHKTKTSYQNFLKEATTRCKNNLESTTKNTTKTGFTEKTKKANTSRNLKNRHRET